MLASGHVSRVSDFYSMGRDGGYNSNVGIANFFAVNVPFMIYQGSIGRFDEGDSCKWMIWAFVTVNWLGRSSILKQSPVNS